MSNNRFFFIFDFVGNSLPAFRYNDGKNYDLVVKVEGESIIYTIINKSKQEIARGASAGYFEFHGNLVDGDKLVYFSLKFNEKKIPEIQISDRYHNSQSTSSANLWTSYAFAKIPKSNNPNDRYSVAGFRGKEHLIIATTLFFLNY